MYLQGDLSDVSTKTKTLLYGICSVSQTPSACQQIMIAILTANDQLITAIQSACCNEPYESTTSSQPAHLFRTLLSNPGNRIIMSIVSVADGPQCFGCSRCIG